MSRIAELSIERPLYPWLLALACLLGGLYGIDNVGRLEDPPFPIKTAYIITQYPGGSALEVEQEVTDVMEAALQQLPQLETMTSKSVPGRSEVQVELKEQFGADETPQIWDELRRRVREAERALPPGVQTPLIEDDFGDVYGIVYGVSTPDYPVRAIDDVAKQLEREAKGVPGVAKVAIAGVPIDAVYVEIAHERLLRLGIPIEAVLGAIGSENRVMRAGSVAYGQRRLRVASIAAFDSVDAIGDLRIGLPGSTQIVRLADIATIVREPVEVPPEIIRQNGEPIFTVAVSVTPGENVVKVGKAVDERLQQIARTLPLGMELHPISRQHVLVETAVSQFMRNLLLSVATVIGALCLFMGWRAGAVVGSVLLLTVMGTLWCMTIFGIELQRISLGALMIAMGMLVDNAIVVAEGMITGVRRGQSPAQAASQAVSRTQYALLGATIIGITAFAPIGLSDDNSGHFLRSLVQVVGISLMLSWVLAISLVPMLGNLLFKPTTSTTDELYGGWGYAPYRWLIGMSLRHAWLATLVIVAITGACLWGFGQVKQAFFPTNNSPYFFVDYYLPQGTDINATARRVTDMETIALAEQEVIGVTSFIGRGTIRYAATLRPEQPNAAYAHLLIRVADVGTMNQLMESLTPKLQALNPDAEMLVRRNEFSPSGSSKVEARFSGPDRNVLRKLTDQAQAEFLSLNLIERKTDWRQRELQLLPQFDDTRARMAGINRADANRAIAFATLGVEVGLYRDRNKLLPIIARAPGAERTDLSLLTQRRIWSPTEQTHVPFAQIVTDFELSGEDNLILRRNRSRTMTAQANLPPGQNFARVFDTLRAPIEAIPLPPGYRLEWGGEYEANLEARTALGGAIPMAFAVMFVITLLLFGKVKQAIVIWLTVPMIVCGVVLSLLLTDLGFTFPAFLGFLSLTGMLIKNCVVLVDEIDKRSAETGLNLDTIAAASVSRLRPVMLASGTTIAGMSPLLGDPFFKEMAVCIMGGLAFATVLTLIAVPVFYRLLIRPQAAAAQAEYNPQA
ncbi:MAG: efflux RND transporter permease subunit [Pseudomonadales bacterium]